MSFPDWWYEQRYDDTLFAEHIKGHPNSEPDCYYCHYDERLAAWRKWRKA